VLKRPARVGSCRNSDVDCVAVQRPLDAQLPKGPVIPEVPYQHVATGCLVSKEKGCIRQHYIQDLLIEATPGGARAVAHLFVMEKDPGKPPVLTIDSGAYVDDLVKGPDGWGIRVKRWMPFR